MFHDHTSLFLHPVFFFSLQFHDVKAYNTGCCGGWGVEVQYFYNYAAFLVLSRMKLHVMSVMWTPSEWGQVCTIVCKSSEITMCKCVCMCMCVCDDEKQCISHLKYSRKINSTQNVKNKVLYQNVPRLEIVTLSSCSYCNCGLDLCCFKVSLSLFLSHVRLNTFLYKLYTCYENGFNVLHHITAGINSLNMPNYYWNVVFA